MRLAGIGIFLQFFRDTPTFLLCIFGRGVRYVQGPSHADPPFALTVVRAIPGKMFSYLNVNIP